MNKNNHNISEMAKDNLTIDTELGKDIFEQINITFHPNKAPEWLLKQLDLQSDSIILILDHPQNHKVWQSKLQALVTEYPNIIVKCFHYRYESELFEFINTSPIDEINRMLLLTIYGSPDHKPNGLEIIIKSKLEKAILISDDHEVLKKIEDTSKEMACKIKILPTGLIETLPIIVNEELVKSPASQVIPNIYYHPDGF